MLRYLIVVFLLFTGPVLAQEGTCMPVSQMILTMKQLGTTPESYFTIKNEKFFSFYSPGLNKYYFIQILKNEPEDVACVRFILENMVKINDQRV